MHIYYLVELACKNNKLSFTNRVLTDGFAMNFIFARRKSMDKVQNIQFDFNDFTLAEINERFQPVAADPGRNQVFTSCYGSGQEPHKIRRISSKEYYAMTGSSERNEKLKKEKREAGLIEIEIKIPTAKIANIHQYLQYIEYVLEHMTELLSFYNPSRAEGRFRNYQGVQRAREEMANVLLDGGK
ncbi:hypothetical protein BGW37DRAFT_424235 [Umbelopsis sp. PMI_123]|nr:hypothetical protein BGW37DRAFT_424235 [Umbelopsis sp. PMI_123]